MLVGEGAHEVPRYHQQAQDLLFRFIPNQFFAGLSMLLLGMDFQFFQAEALRDPLLDGADKLDFGVLAEGVLLHLKYKKRLHTYNS